MSSSSPPVGHKRSASEAALVESDRDYLQFTPLGGGCEVGRSCHILQFKGKVVMLDCIAGGTLVALESGTSVPIEAVQPGQRVLALSSGRDGLVGRTVQAVLPKGDAACIELLFNDGRTLVCTPDHRLLGADGGWCKAGELTPGTSEVRVGIDYPAISPPPAGLHLDVGGHLTLDQHTAPLFCRLMGALLADGTVTLQTGRVASYTAKLFVGHELDRDAVLRDIRAVTGVDATVDDGQDHITAVIFPLALQRAALQWVSPGERTSQLTALPPYLLDAACPIELVCEFLGGLFGGDGHTLSYAHQQGIFRGLGFSWSKKGRACSVEEQRRAGLAAEAPTPLPLAQAKVFEQIVQLLRRAGVEDAAVVTPRSRVGTNISEKSAERVKKAKTEGRTLSKSVSDAADFEAHRSYEIRVNIGVRGVLPFAGRIGFRYCCHKQVRLTAAAAYVRSGEYIAQQRVGLRQRVRELKLGLVKGMAQAKDEHRAVALLHPDNEAWRPLQENSLNAVAPRGNGATRLTAEQAMQEWGIADLFSEERKGVPYDHSKTLPHAQRTEPLRRAGGLCLGCAATQAEGGFCAEACQRAWQRKLDEAAEYSEQVCSQGPHGTVHYSPPRGVLVLPTFKVKLLAKREAGVRSVYDLSVPTGEANGDIDSFQANGIIVHNCGLHPAYSGIASLPYFDEINPADIDLILITHFHLDHAAALPYFLEKTAFRGRVFMTHPTKSVYKLILQDYVKVSSISVEETLYTERDLLASMDKIECVNYHQVVEHRGVKLWAYNAGHVLGAAMFMLEIGGVRILYTGDYSRTEDRHLMAAELPLPSLYPHVLIIEATYGTQTLRPVEEREGRFCSLVQEIVEERGGSCLIPVFALGRAQELLLILDEYWEAHPSLQAVPIYYASFLAKKCMTVYQTYLNMMNAHIQRQAQVRNPFHFKYVFNVKSLNDFDDSVPCVILASPGMLQNGVSRELLEMWCSDEKNGVIIAGYAVEGTLAKHIMTEPTHITSVGGARLPLRMSVNYISFSAHADYRETSEFIDALRPAHCILVHGDVNEGVGKLKAALLDKYGASMNCQGPKNGQTVELEFKQTKIVKTVGRLAEGEDVTDGETGGGGAGIKDGRVMKGVIVRKDFVYTFMAVEDLPNFTPISCTSIKQTLLIPFHHTFAAFRTFIQQLFIPDSDDEDEVDDAVEDDAAAGATEKGEKGEKKEKAPTLRIHGSVIGRWYVGRVELEWESSPVDDMIADSVVSLLTSVQATVGGAKMIGVSHQHAEKDIDAPAATTTVKAEPKGETRGVKKEEAEMKVPDEEDDADTQSVPSSPSSTSSSPSPRSPSPSLLFALELQYGPLLPTEASYVVTVDGSTASINRATLDVLGEDEVLVKRVRASVVRWEGSRGGGVRERWASEDVGWRMEELEARLKVDDPTSAVLGI